MALASTFKYNKFIGNFLKIWLGGRGANGLTRGGWEADVRTCKRGADGRHRQTSGRGADGKRMGRQEAKGRACWADERMEADNG